MDIVTDRLRLRQLQVDDAAWLAREIANPEVQRWLTSPPHPYSLAHAQAFIARCAENSGYRMIEQADTPLGVVSLTSHDETIPDLGYWLCQSAWGQGIMTEAAAALLDWHFAQGGDVVSSGWIRGNDASRNVLAKLGFVAHGSKQARSAFHDADVKVDKVRLTAKAWQTLRAKH